MTKSNFNYTIDELSFILYNNRSVSGVVKNFLPNFNPYRLIKIEDSFEKSKSKFTNQNKMVEFNKNELDFKAKDVEVNKEDLMNLTRLIKQNISNFNEEEYNFLTKRGITDYLIEKWSILGLSQIKDYRNLEIIGSTCHPVLRTILDDGIENGGILIPLFENETLVNCATRKINSSKSLKYSLSCPDIPVWGLDSIGLNEEIWITEGLFDMMALIENGKNAVSCSSAMWSGLQLYQLLEKRPKKLVIFADNDEVGLRTSFILHDFFTTISIESEIFVSEIAKDPSEHFFEKKSNFENIKKIQPSLELLSSKQDDSFNFLEYLKNRTI
jgi:hypothetical protein